MNNKLIVFFSFLVLTSINIKLTAQESQTYISSSDFGANINLKHTIGNYWHLSGPRKIQNGTPFSIYYHNGSTFSSSSYFSILNNGNVGIGLDNPTRAKFELNGHVSNTTAILGSGGAGVSFTQDWPGVYYNGYWNGSNNALLANGFMGKIQLDPHKGDFYFGTASEGTSKTANSLSGTTTRLFIKQDGKIGIGNLDPGFLLDVAGRSRIRSGGGASAGIWLMNSTNTINRGFVGMVDDNYIGFYGEGGAYWGLVMDINKKIVGIGLVDKDGPPRATLDVGRGTADQTVLIRGSEHSSYFHVGDLETVHIRAGKATSPVLINDGHDGNVIISTGKGSVGIGTNYPGEYKLAVKGKIRAQELVIELANWPDYVFENDYKLKSLKEVETFVKENKHLPEVPSAKEVEEQGVSVGKMENILLKKVEELTLYLIEQNKQIQALQDQNKKLESKLETIVKEGK